MARKPKGGVGSNQYGSKGTSQVQAGYTAQPVIPKADLMTLMKSDIPPEVVQKLRAQPNTRALSETQRQTGRMPASKSYSYEAPPGEVERADELARAKYSAPSRPMLHATALAGFGNVPAPQAKALDPSIKVQRRSWRDRIRGR